MIRNLLLLFLIISTSCGVSVKKEITAHREIYREEFLQDPRSPLLEEDLQYLDFFPPTAKGRVKAKFKLTPEAEPFEMPTYSGITRTYRKWGEAKFLWMGDSVSLAIYQNLTFLSNPVYDDYLFLPFKDASNSITTYGGGRYLNISKKDTEDNLVTLDFNKSYNPWCAYCDGYNCPIPPKENHLPFEIPAGEKNYKGVPKHK